MTTSFSPRMVIAAWLLAVALVVPSSSTEVTAQPPRASVSEGMVLSVDAKTISLRSDRDNDTHSFWVAPAASITLDGRPVVLTEINPGDYAKISATRVGPRFLASEIDARSPL